MSKVNILDLCKSFNINKSICPKCNREKLWIKDDYFRCFKSNCNASGNFINYVMLVKSLDFKSACNLLRQDFDYIDLSSLPFSDNHFINRYQRERRDLLSRIFNVCKQYKNEPSVINYLKERGLDPNKIEYGFWPINSNGKKDLIQLNTSFKLNQLKLLKLINNKNEEVFANRIVFPIKNLSGDIIYYQGRSLNPDDSLRWLTSANDDKSEQSVFSYFYNTNILNKDNEVVFVCEGISDALSLQQLDLNVVSSLNLYPPLLKYKEVLSKVNYLVAFYDNDKRNLEGNSYIEYKSWDSVLNILIDLKLMKPELQIYCIMPPEVTGITDINEWLLSINFDKELALTFIKQNILLLEEFLIEKFLSSRKDDIFKILSVLPEYSKNELKLKLLNKVNSKYTNWIDFVIS